jgi:hypothetical protein
MIEVSLTEIFLFAWATLATAYAFKCKAEEQKANHFVKLFLTDKGVRAKITEDFDAWEKRNAD